MTLSQASDRLELTGESHSLKKETIITAAVFLAVGFLAGYVYNAQRNSAPEEPSGRAPVAAAPSEAASEPASASGGEPTAATAPSGLPPGHPPLDGAATIKMLESEAAAQPANPRPRLELANFLYDQKRFREAIPWYQRALDLDPKNVNARTDLGTAYFSLGQAADAVREYRQSLEVDPSHQPTLYNLALVNLEGTHDVAAARDAYARLTKLNPNYPGLDALKQGLKPSGGSKAGEP
ncbi:MAG TPA: tetratricopeptide repeat protein [Terriglobia bacterium]|nr:tetratricopeptide repeat protein [Terriglobia bacterium]